MQQPAKGGTPTTQTGSKTVSVSVITDAVDESTQKPLRTLQSVPPATKLIYAAVDVDLKKGQTLSAKWYYENRHQAALDTSLPVDSDFKGWASFHISNDKPWPTGNYYVEVYVDGQIQRTNRFEVKYSGVMIKSSSLQNELFIVFDPVPGL